MTNRLRFALLTFVCALTSLSPWGAEAQLDCSNVVNSCEPSDCRTPATPVPSSLWRELRPAEIAIPDERDSTDHSGTEGFTSKKPFWFSVDVENGYLFTAYTSGFEIWDVKSNPATPARLTTVDGRRGGFPTFTANLENKFPVTDVDAPAGDDSILAVSAQNTVGLSIWSTVEKGGPRALYQDYGDTREFEEVYAARIGATKYAFGASPTLGLRIYDMSRAAALTNRCLDEAPANTCGVYKGRLGTRTAASFVAGTGNLVAMSAGTVWKGVEVWNLSNPDAPVLAGTWNPTEKATGLAMWSENNGATHYLAVRVGLPEQLRIYDVSCAASGSCTPGSPLSAVNIVAEPSQAPYVTFSRSGSTPFLHLGGLYLCVSKGKTTEFLFDVTNPSAPREITPPDGIVNGVSTGYWKWYYRTTPTGFNWIGPRRAVFWGEYLYRAANGILDIHKLGSSVPSATFTWAPTQVFVGTAVNFTDQSIGAPTSWLWSFEGSGTANSTLQNPSNITFTSLGTKSVSLRVCNDRGCDTSTKTINVVDPMAAVGGVTVSPTALSSCVTATFTATAVTGKLPLTYEWLVRPAAGADIPLACTGNPCAWVVPSALATGSYSVVVTVKNAENPTGAVATTPFNLEQQTLAFLGAPTADPTTTGIVQFHVQSTGAKEWSWNFGDGQGFRAYSTDPINGPHPKNSYSVSGTKGVQVKIKDCNGLELTSDLLLIDVTAIPLVASFLASCPYGLCGFDTGATVNFVDSSEGGPETWSYDWTHVGSDPATCTFSAPLTAPRTSYTYTSAGNYRPCLKVTRGNDTSVEVHSKELVVVTSQPPPTPKVSITGASTGTVGSPVVFYAASSNCTPASSGWKWTINGGGSGSSTQSSIAVTWSTVGTKSVQVSNTGCSGATATKSVTISSGSTGTTLGAQFTYSPTTISAGQVVSFNGSSSVGSPTSYAWNFGDGSVASGAQVTHTFANGGTFQVTLSVAKAGQGPGCYGGYCSDDEIKTIVVSGTPVVPLKAAFTWEPSPVYAGKAVTFDGTSSTGSPTSFEWTFGDGSAKPVTSTATHTFAKAGSYQVKLMISKPGSGTGCSYGFCINELTKTVVVEPPRTGLCEDDPKALCLSNGRFKVTTEWKKPDGLTTGVGTPIGITDDTGYFWFEYPSNVEVVTKVLDGCGVNDNRWVFAAGLTNIEVTMTVTDKVTGAVKTYVNPQGTAFEPIQDTKAFSCTGTSRTAEYLWMPAGGEPREWIEIQDGEPRPVGKAYAVSGTVELAPNATCTPDATTLCLNDNRFRVEAWWGTAEGVGAGQGVSLGGDTGYFWFFNQSNVELIIKVLNGCALNSRYWVFAGGLTNVEVRIMVTDMMTGKFKEYVNPRGEAFPPYQDTDAINECF